MTTQNIFSHSQNYLFVGSFLWAVAYNYGVKNYSENYLDQIVFGAISLVYSNVDAKRTEFPWRSMLVFYSTIRKVRYRLC